MRVSRLSQVLCGTAVVSAAIIPSRVSKRQDDVFDPSQFPGAGTFEIKDPAEIKANFDDTLDKSTLVKPSDIVSIAAISCTSPSVRIEWRDMADSDKKSFIDAVKCLMGKPSVGGFPSSTNRYEDIVSVHMQMAPWIHNLPQFLPWHRGYVSIFEEILRDECSFNTPMPWWDESKDTGNFQKSPLFTSQWFGTLKPKNSDNTSPCVTDGAFANTRLNIGPFSGACLARGVDESFNVKTNAENEAICNSFVTYNGHATCNEDGPHNSGHNSIGSTMGEPTASPNDPVFFLHHANVDHLWNTWQLGDTTNRLYQIAGNAGNGQTLTLDFVLDYKGLKPNMKAQDVMDTKNLCYTYSYL